MLPHGIPTVDAGPHPGVTCLRNDAHEVLHDARLLLDRHPDARLLLVGGGPMEQAISVQVSASPAAHAIRLVGRVPHTEVDRYYALADVMAYPRKASRLTDLVTPLKPLEAMAQGCPVVSKFTRLHFH